MLKKVYQWVAYIASPGLTGADKTEGSCRVSVRLADGCKKRLFTISVIKSKR